MKLSGYERPITWLVIVPALCAFLWWGFFYLVLPAAPHSVNTMMAWATYTKALLK